MDIHYRNTITGAYRVSVGGPVDFGGDWVECPVRPGPDATWGEGVWVPGPPPAPTNAEVNAEREQRVLLGKTFTVTGYANPIAVTGDSTTQTNLLALATAAQARIASGDMATLTPYRDGENVVHHLAPPQVFELWSKGAEYISQIYQSSWALKDDPSGIATDFTDDEHWPG